MLFYPLKSDECAPAACQTITPIVYNLGKSHGVSISTKRRRSEVGGRLGDQTLPAIEGHQKKGIHTLIN